LDKYSIIATVKEVRGFCPIYGEGDRIVFESHYIKSKESCDVCIHAMSSMLTLLSAFIHGISAVDLGIGKQEDTGYLQCPDPGEPHTCGGTVVFRLERKKLSTT